MTVYVCICMYLCVCVVPSPVSSRISPALTQEYLLSIQVSQLDWVILDLVNGSYRLAFFLCMCTYINFLYNSYLRMYMSACIVCANRHSKCFKEGYLTYIFQKGSKFYAHMYSHTHPHYTYVYTLKLQNCVLSNELDQVCNTYIL